MIARSYPITLLSADGTILRGVCWKPNVAPVAAACLVHGLGEHSGKYDQWARNFCSKGFIVYAVDYRGHGESEGKRGHANNMHELLDDIEAMVTRCKRNWGNLPVYLYGHSMGGTLALAFLKSRHHDFRGAIITSPWLRLVKPPRFITRKLGAWFNDCLGGLTFNTGLKPAQMSRGSIKAEEQDKDPLMHGKISLRLFNLIDSCAATFLFSPLVLQIPTLLLHGGADPVTCPAATGKLSQAAKGDVRFILYGDAFHELHNEPEASQVFSDIVEFVKATLPGNSCLHEESRVSHGS